MFSILLFLVILIRLALNYNIPTFVQQDSISVPITSNGYDPCRFFKIKNSSLYRMGQSNIISRWNLNSFAYAQQAMYETTNWTENVLNIAIGQNYSEQMTVTILTAAPTKKFDVLYPSTLIKASGFSNTTSATYTITKVQTTSTQYMQLIYSNISSNYLNTYDKNMTLTSQMNLGIKGFMNSTLSQDQSALVIWNYEGKVKFMQKLGLVWTCFVSYAPSANIQAMNDVALSKNGTFGILQYDSLSPLIVYNFRGNTIFSLKNFANTIINQAMFLDDDCHLIALTVNHTILQIYDTFTLTLQSSTVFNSISNYSAIDYSTGKLYFCIQENIQVYKISCPSLTYRSLVTNQCLSVSLINNCNGYNQDTGFCSSCSENYTLNSSTFLCQIQIFPDIANNGTNSTNATQSNLSQSNASQANASQTNTNQSNTTQANASLTNTTNSTNSTVNNESQNNYTSNYNGNNLKIKSISQTQGYIANTTLKSFDYISPVIATIFTVLQISPFALIFLSFMNYWNLCCLYSILDINVPEYLPQIHEKIFQAIQVPIFQKLGLNPTVSPLNDENVSSTYFFIDYGISLDFINPNIQNLLMIAFVLGLILLIILLRNLIFQKSAYLYKILHFNFVQSILGQFISFVPFCILPYRFLLNSPVSNFTLKINMFLQATLLMLCFSAPSIFIWSRGQLYMQGKLKSNLGFKKISTKKTMVKNLINKIKSKDTKIQNQNLKQLQMFIVNITVPLLIILPNYLPFFIVNLVIFINGVKKASKTTQYRINSIISACYLPFYHICYIMFYLFGQNECICHYVGIFCLVALFLGGIHELCNVIILSLIDFVIWAIKTIKQFLNKQQKNQHENFKTEEKSNQNFAQTIFKTMRINTQRKKITNLLEAEQKQIKKQRSKMIILKNKNSVYPFSDQNSLQVKDKSIQNKVQIFKPKFKKLKLKTPKNDNQNIGLKVNETSYNLQNTQTKSIQTYTQNKDDTKIRIISQQLPKQNQYHKKFRLKQIKKKALKITISID